ncbi:mitochondrial FAD carrier protein [Scheffersomyces xylosifermentans]|uniref:mitochondrial FAD carrier protein n=1 Tax=Scheffersomyces xylosifermentans TaxID=1304137 RepID=UPI00315D0D8B
MAETKVIGGSQDVQSNNLQKSRISLSRRQTELIAGLSAGFSTTVVTHPLDLIKIRLQLSIADINGANNKRFGSILGILNKINEDAVANYNKARLKPQQTRRGLEALNNYKSTHLVRQFYRGITPNLVGNISAWGLYFTLYAEFKSMITTGSSTINYFSSSTLAGISTSLLTNPLWVLKTRILASSRNDSKAYKSITDGVISILRKEGILSFWRGTIPSMFSVFQGSLQFTFYDNFKNYTQKRYETDQLTTAQYIYISATSKIFSMSIMYPSQVVRSILQNYEGKSKDERTIRSAVKHLWSKEGIRGFYKGISANILRVVPATCITFVVYESVKNRLTQLEKEETP